MSSEVNQGQLENGQAAQCPSCKRTLDGFTSFQGVKPSDGDISICGYCNAINQFAVSENNEITLIETRGDHLVNVDFLQLQKTNKLAASFREIFQTEE